MKGIAGRPRNDELPKDGDLINDHQRFYCQLCGKIAYKGHYCDHNGEVIKVCIRQHEQNRGNIPQFI